MVVDHPEGHGLSNSSGELHLDNLKKICEISSTIGLLVFGFLSTEALDNS